MNELTIGCNCGYYHYIHVSKWPEGYFFTIIDRPTTFWERVKKLFKRDTHWREVELSQADVDRLVDFLADKEDK